MLFISSWKLFFLKIFNFCPDFFGHVGIWLDKKAKVNCKIYDFIKVIITIRILPGISRSKGNQTMKFGQLIEFNVRNIYFKNHAKNKVGRLVPDLFLLFKKALYKVNPSG